MQQKGKYFVYCYVNVSISTLYLSELNQKSVMRKIIMTLLVAIAFVLSATAQDRIITGKVTDPSGQAVSNASVVVPGGKTGTTTNADGSFSLSVPNAVKALQISAVNFETQRVIISGNTANASLILSQNALEEVVVTGIKTIRRAEYAGAVSRINKDVIENKPVGSFDQLLQGAAPGLLALTGSGQPGSAANIIIRGQTSIAGGSTPLYVIDGIPVEAGVFQGMNANDILTLDVLKDAASLALYGSRGGAGVIVMTTKKGTSGKLKLGYNVQMGIKSRPEFGFSPMNTTQLLQSQNDYGKVLGTPGNSSIPGWYYATNNPRYATLTAVGQADATRRLDSISKINTNWADYMFRTAPFSNHELTLSGGTGKTRIYSSLGLYNEDGVTPRTDMKRISFRNNIDYADDKITFALTSSIAYTKRNFQQSTVTNSTGNPFLAVNITTPYARVFKNDGTYFTGNGSSYSGAVAASFTGANQLDLTRFDENYNNQVKAILGMSVAYKITDNITAGLTSGLDFRETQTTNYGSKLAFLRVTSTSITGKAGFQNENLGRYFLFNVRPSLNFRKQFAEKHTVDVSVYGEMLKEYTKSISFTGFGIDPRTPNTPASITPGNASNQLFITAGGGKSQNALISGLAIASYTFKDKYSVSGSYRQDGSSQLPTATRWQDFYSVSGIWTISNEEFLKSNSVVNSLRLRASYGGAGDKNNFPFGDFGYLDTYTASGNYSGLTTQSVSNIGNPLLRWETTWTANVGTDFSLFNSRLYGSVDIYSKITRDLFVQKQLTAPAGGYTTIINAGKLGNKGVELDLGYDLIKNSKVTWTVKGNVGYNKNEIISIAGEQPYTSGTSRITEGLPLGSHFEVSWAGVDQATGAPLYYKKNGTITTIYSADDKVQNFGTWEAPWKGGFSSSLRFGGFDISVLFTFQQGAKKVDNLEYFVENPIGFLSGGYNQSASLNFWKQPGDVATTPSPLYATNFSSKIIHDASFIRLRDLTFSYTVPKATLKNNKIVSNARFFVQGSNLFIWTKWRGMDPEAGPNNINLSEFPNPRAITAGLNITF